jgi:hypothetical protein
VEIMEKHGGARRVNLGCGNHSGIRSTWHKQNQGKTWKNHVEVNCCLFKTCVFCILGVSDFFCCPTPLINPHKTGASGGCFPVVNGKAALKPNVNIS